MHNPMLSEPRKLLNAAPSSDADAYSALFFAIRVIVILGYLASSLLAFSETPSLSPMVHVSWTARDGAPQAIRTLGQASDGTLWIGTDGDLFVFDGITFHAFESLPGEPRLPSNGILSVCALSDGSIWVGMYHGGMARASSFQGAAPMSCESGVQEM